MMMWQNERETEPVRENYGLPFGNHRDEMKYLTETWGGIDGKGTFQGRVPLRGE